MISGELQAALIAELQERKAIGTGKHPENELNHLVGEVRTFVREHVDEQLKPKPEAAPKLELPADTQQDASDQQSSV
jgi:hypothetical protein